MRSRSNAQRSILAAPYGGETYNWPYAARNIGYCAIWVCISSSSRKRTGDTETGWRPPPDKNIEPVPHWGKKKSPKNCLVYLGRETEWALRLRRLDRRKDAR